MDNKNLLEKNYNFFKKNLNSLLKTKKHKIVLIESEKIIKTFDSYKEAFQFATQTFKLGTFILQEVDDTPVYLSRITL